MNIVDENSTQLSSSLRPSAPLISQTTAHLLFVLFTCSYVLPFYLSRRTRPSPTLSRDSPDVIRARIALVSIACCACASVTLGILLRARPDGSENSVHGHDKSFSTNDGNGGEIAHGDDGGEDASRLTFRWAIRLLGWWPVVPADVARVMLLTCTLFAGPLFEEAVVEGGWRRWGRWTALKNVLGGWVGIRNFVAGPASEELLFRSLILTLHVLSLYPFPPSFSIAKVASASTHTSTSAFPSTQPQPPNPSTILLIPPLYFAIAHVHHYYEFRLTHPAVGAGPALARSLLQFGYTSLFGAYAGFVFLRTGSLVAVVLAHAFCNWIGLPRLWGMVGAGWYHYHNEGNDGQDDRVGKGRLSATVWAMTVSYYFLLVAGVVGFWKGLYPLTRSHAEIISLGK